MLKKKAPGDGFGEAGGAPGAIPTRDLPLRRRTLYAAELREHKESQSSVVRSQLSLEISVVPSTDN